MIHFDWLFDGAGIETNSSTMLEVLFEMLQHTQFNFLC